MYKQISAAGLVILGLGACTAPDAIESDSLEAVSTEIIDVTGSVAADQSEQYGPIDLPVGSSLTAVLSLTRGDADLYVRSGQAPTLNAFDCRPYFSGTASEICDVTGPAMVYLGVVGYARDSDFSLSVTVTSDDPTCGNATLDPGEACDGKPSACSDVNAAWGSGTATCLNDCSGFDESACEPVSEPTDPGDATEQRYSAGLHSTLTAGEWKHFGPFNSTSDGQFRALIGHNPDGHPGSGDVDMYVRRGATPTKNNYDCKSDASGSVEGCTLDGGGLIYVSVLGYAGQSSYSFEAYYFTDANTSQPTIERYIGSVNEGMWYVLGPYDGNDATVEVILAGRNDTDLYVRSGAPPTETEWDCRPYLSGPDEGCNLSSPGQFWIGVRGYSSSPAYFDVRTVIIDQ